MMTHPNFELTPQSNPLTILKQALTSYDETINFCHRLPLETDNQRKMLADAYLNRGNVLRMVGSQKSDDLEQALASYDQAIQVAKDLPLEIPDHCTLLACAYLERGNVLQALGKLELDAFHHTIEAAEQRHKNRELAKLLREWLETDDAEYDERVGSLLEQELQNP